MVNISYSIHSLLKQRWSTYHTAYTAYKNKGGQHIIQHTQLTKTKVVNISYSIHSLLNKGGQHIIQHTQLTKTKVVNISYNIHNLLKQRWSTYHTAYTAYLNKGGQHIIQHT